MIILDLFYSIDFIGYCHLLFSIFIFSNKNNKVTITNTTHEKKENDYLTER